MNSLACAIRFKIKFRQTFKFNLKYLAEITLLGTYTYSTVDLQATVNLLSRNAFGDLSWVEKRSLDDGPQAFMDLHAGKTAAAKVLLKPFQ